MTLATIETITDDPTTAAQCLAVARPDAVIPEDLEMAVELLEINTPAQADQAGGILADIQRLRKAVEEKFEGPTRLAHAAWKALTSWRGECLKPIEAAEGAVKRKIGAWQQAEQTRLLAEQRQREEESRQRAEEERKRLEAEVAAQAVALEAEGRAEEAEELRADATEAIAQVVESQFLPPMAAPKVKVAGTSISEDWKAAVVDFDAFFEEAYQNKQLRAYWEPKQTAINQGVKALKGAFKVRGLRVWCEQRVTGRGR